MITNSLQINKVSLPCNFNTVRVIKAKYFGMGKGVSVYSFVDESVAAFYSTVISASEREATYVLDGLMHNETYWNQEKEWFHHTDTHGQSEVIFGVANMLGISLAPRIKGLKSKTLYGFKTPKYYKDCSYILSPKHRIKIESIISEWDNVLRLVSSIKLKRTIASSVFNRISTYTSKHPLHQALKQFGRIYRTTYILKYYDELKLRQQIEKQLNRVEKSHQFAQAVFFDHNRQIRQELKEDQDIAISCRILLQNVIILWNCLHLSELLLNEKDTEERSSKIELIKEGTACTWQHVNFQGTYEFDNERMPSFSYQKIKEILDMSFE